MIWLIPYMAVMSRSCGGWPKLPWGLAQWLYAIPYMYISPLAAITAFIGKRMGHGRGMSIFEPMDGDPERVEILISWLQPWLPVWLYKCLILTLCEAVVWSGAAMVNPWLLGCALNRPLSYLAGWGVFIWADKTGRVELRESDDGKRAYKAISFMPRPLDRHTAIGEALVGLVAGVVLFIRYGV